MQSLDMDGDKKDQTRLVQINIHEKLGKEKLNPIALETIESHLLIKQMIKQNTLLSLSHQLSGSK